MTKMVNNSVQKMCKIGGCNKKRRALGLCNMHYHRQWRHGDPLIVYKKGLPAINVGKCIIPGCIGDQYIRHLCEAHYHAWNKWGDPKLLKKVGAPRGPQNGNWRGGIAYYRDHSLMKRLRLQRLKQVNYKCECCGARANFIYHKNGDKQDQRVENYLALCKECFYHYPKRITNTKYIRLYGKNLVDLAKYYGVRPATLLYYLVGRTKHPYFLRRPDVKKKGVDLILRRNGNL